MLAKVTLPDAVPDAVGAKRIETEALLPAAIVTGRVIPLSENSDWLAVADEIVTGAVLALSVAVWLWLVPTTTLPKLMLEGVTASCPGDVAVPDSGTDCVGFAAFELMAREPLALPAAVGANATLKVTL